MGAAATATSGAHAPRTGWIGSSGLQPGTDPRRALERDILPAYLARCRWYAGQGRRPARGRDRRSRSPVPTRSTTPPWPSCASRRPDTSRLRYVLPAGAGLGATQSGLPERPIARFDLGGSARPP